MALGDRTEWSFRVLCIFVREGFYDGIDSEGNENTSEKKVAIKSGEKSDGKKY